METLTGFGSEPQIFNGAGAQFEDTLRKSRLHPGTNHQFLVLQVQLSKSIEEFHAIGTGETNGYFPPKRPRQRWDRALVGPHRKYTQLEGSDVGEVADQGYERTERREEVVEGEIREGFSERRETIAEILLTDGIDPKAMQLKATNTT